MLAGERREREREERGRGRGSRRRAAEAGRQPLSLSHLLPVCLELLQHLPFRCQLCVQAGKAVLEAGVLSLQELKLLLDMRDHLCQGNGGGFLVQGGLGAPAPPLEESGKPPPLSHDAASNTPPPPAAAACLDGGLALLAQLGQLLHFMESRGGRDRRFGGPEHASVLPW